MEADIQIYLNFIRGLGIKAWIPGIPGSGPKMSEINQCRCGVLCLNYEGTDIYIQGISRRTKNDKSCSTELVENLYHAKSVKLENDQLDRFGDGLGNTALNDNLGVNITSRDDEVKCRRAVGTQWSYKDIIDDSPEMPKFPKSTSSHLKKSVGTRVYGIAEQKSFVTDITGVVYKRIVEEKLTREVRVAKCYVSSLPGRVLKRGSGDATKKKNGHLDKRSLRSDNTGKLWRSMDMRLDEIKKSGLSPGFVRQLIKRFDVYDNVEQQRPSRKTL